MAVLNTTGKKILAAAVAVATLGTSMTAFSSSADAQYYRRGNGYNRGAAVGLGVLGGVAAGAIIAGAARPGYGYYDGPVYDEPAYVVDGPVCHIERRKVYLDDVTYKIRKVRVCD